MDVFNREEGKRVASGGRHFRPTSGERLCRDGAVRRVAKLAEGRLSSRVESVGFPKHVRRRRPNGRGPRSRLCCARLLIKRQTTQTGEPCANCMVSRTYTWPRSARATRSRCLDPRACIVHALPALVTQSTCWLSVRSALLQATSCSTWRTASMQLHTAVRAALPRAGSSARAQSLTSELSNLVCAVQAAACAQPAAHSRRVIYPRRVTYPRTCHV
jgi:hypothetical protein